MGYNLAEYNLNEAFSKGRGYGYSKNRMSYFSEIGTINSLSHQYLTGMIEGYKEYDNPYASEAFKCGVRVGRLHGEMTNLASKGKCLTESWRSAEKDYNKSLKEFEEFLNKRIPINGLFR